MSISKQGWDSVSKCREGHSGDQELSTEAVAGTLCTQETPDTQEALSAELVRSNNDQLLEANTCNLNCH